LTITWNFVISYLGIAILRLILNPKPFKIDILPKETQSQKILALTNASKSHAKGWYFEILILWSHRGFQVEYFDK